MSMVQLEKEGNVAIITLNNPPVNALNSQLLGELEETVDSLYNDSEVGALVITGAGEKAFVAGADISEFPSLTKDNGEKLARRGQSVFQKIADLPFPVVAAVNGFALGGGMELALACDIRVASDNAQVGLPEVTLGIFPGYGGTQRLPRLIPSGKAKELIFTGDQIKAEEAAQVGIVEHVVPAGEALGKAKEIAGKIVKRAPLAIKEAKKAVNQGLDMTLEEGQKLEASLFGGLCETEDQKEGAKAFLEKRKPEYKGK